MALILGGCAVQGEAGAAVHRLPRRCRHARLRSRERRRALVWDGTTNGKGSENYVDDARKLGPEHLKFIDDFISETHAAGGTVSVPTCADELAKKFARLYVSEGCVRYAMVNYCDAGGQKDGPSTTTSFTSRSVGFTG